MKNLIFLFVVSSCFSCGLFPKYKKTSFSYSYNGNGQTMALLVPKGAKKQDIQIDSLGNTINNYWYGNGTHLYFAWLKDSTVQLQPIDTTRHVAQPAPQGGRMYKEMDTKWQFWREIQDGYFRAGYRQVPFDSEIRFDSSLNYAAKGNGIKN